MSEIEKVVEMDNDWASTGDTELLQGLFSSPKSRAKIVTEIFYRFERQLLKFFISKVQKLAVAEDLLQELMIKLMKVSSGSKHIENGRAWLFSVANNVWIDHLRRERSLQRLVEDVARGFEEWPPESQSRDIEECVEEGLWLYRRQHPAEWYALSQQLDGESVADIAITIDRTVGATYEFLSQSRKKIRQFVAPCLEHFAGN